MTRLHASRIDTSSSDVTDALQFALLTEYLSAEFYNRGLNAVGLIPSGDRRVISAISAHESAHLGTVRQLLVAAGGAAQAKPDFDFTAHGELPGFAFLPDQYDMFLVIAHIIEDTSVRAYTGHLAHLMADKATLTAALAIHSAEARHACVIRRIRGCKGWITANSRDDLPGFAQATYDGEDNPTQRGVNVLAVATVLGGGTSATESFDEPLTLPQAAAMLAHFLAG